MKHKIALFIFIIFVANSFIFGQSAKEQLAIANSGKLISENFYEEIKFTDKLGYFTIPIKIDTTQYEYIFDTGGYNTVTTQVMQNANLPILMEVEVGSANKIKSKVKLSKIPSLQIAKATFEDVGVFNFDFSASTVINCYTNAGLIGKSVIKEAVWQIDYRNSVIRVSDNLANMPYLNEGEKIKIELDKTLNPFLKIDINGKQERFLIDFGYGGLISLTEKLASTLHFKHQLTIEGEGDVSANGIMHEKTFVSALEKLMIGKTELKNQIAYYSKSNNYNTLGSELAKYFIVTLNFKEGEMILTPYNDSADSYETFGFSVNIDNNKIYVSKLYSNLNAQKAGLCLNDELIKINEKELTDIPLCDRYFIVNHILKNDKEILIQIKRDNVQKEFKIVKQKPF